MCGIIGYIGFRDPKEILLEGLKNLDYRGYDSAGIAVLETTGVQIFRSEGRVENLERTLKDRIFKASLGIGHTRWATHGAPTEINAHPHRSGAVTLIVNGIIENYLSHKEVVLGVGRKIASETDSEILAHLLDLEVQSGKDLLSAVMAVVPKLTGAYAFVAMNEDDPDTLVGVRKGPPLLIGLGEKENFIASDVQAVLDRTNRIIYLNDEEVALCRRDSVKVVSFQGKSIPIQEKKISWTPDQREKLGYQHYMLKEIHEQVAAITQTIEGNIDHSRGVIAALELLHLKEGLAKTKRISIAACGTAKHAALIGKFYIERFARVPVDVDFASEFRYRDPVFNGDSLQILISQSGETADTLAALREAKTKGVKTLAICNVRDSTIARESDVVLYTNAGPEIGVASTKAFTTQVVVLYMLAVELGWLRGVLPENYCQELTKDLLRLPLLVERALQLDKSIEQLAKEHTRFRFFFYMGRGINYPIALEGALKLKEISYLHAEGYPAGEIKHGPIALIDKDVMTIVLAPQEIPYQHRDAWAERVTSPQTLYEKLMSNLQEVKARGAQIVSFGTEQDNSLRNQSLRYAGIPAASWAMNPILLSIPVQLLAYYIALERGTDIDKPRNLAKSVTVE